VALLKGMAGYLFWKRADKQKNLYHGVQRNEPFVIAGLCFVAALAALGFWAWGATQSLSPDFTAVLGALLQLLSLTLKVFFFCWLFVWVRWTLPRFRYDQLMNLGWKVMLPLALLNLLVTGVIILTQK
jgi:NADH-quinone oxidoreductase subunit H